MFFDEKILNLMQRKSEKQCNQPMGDKHALPEHGWNGAWHKLVSS